MTDEPSAGDGADEAATSDEFSTSDESSTSDEPATCDEAGCDRPAAVRLHIPWSDDRSVCTAHARVLARPDGVVAEPIEGAEWS